MSASKFPLYVVPPEASLEDALALIEENRHRTVIVVGEGDVVVGTLSDGDARKAILDRRLLSTPVQSIMNTNFVAVTADEAGEADALFERENIFVIPVVGERGELLDLLFAYD